MDGFNLAPYGHVVDNVLIVSQDMVSALLRKYGEQVAKISHGPLAEFRPNIEGSIDLITVTMNSKSEIVEVQGFVEGTAKSTKPTPEQAFEVTRLFHIFYCMSTLFSHSIKAKIPVTMEMQKSNICSALSSHICLDSEDFEVQFLASRKNGLVTFVKYGELSWTIQRKSLVKSYPKLVSVESVFPKIITRAALDQLQQDYEELQVQSKKLLTAAKSVLGSKVNLELMIAHFQAHPDGMDGSRAILDNQLRTKQVRRNSI